MSEALGALISEPLGWIDNLFVNGFASALIACAFYLLTYAVARRVIAHLLAKWKHSDADLRSRFMSRCINSAAVILLLVSCMNQLKAFEGLMSTFMAGSGVVAVAAGIAMQSTLGNLANGVIILFQKPFDTGDVVCLTEKNITGAVELISASHTTLVTDEGARIYVPNSLMATAIVERKNVTSPPDIRSLGSGVVTIFQNPFRKGDVLSLTEKNITGTIEQVTTRHTMLITAEGARIFVPNSLMATAIIERRSGVS